MAMPGLDVSMAFFGAALLLGLAPGPDNIFVLTQSALYGVRAGIATTLGLMSGVCFHTVAVAAGVAVIFQSSPLVFNLFKCLGAGYLCWLAWLAFRATASHAGSGTPKAFPGYAALYRRGIIMNVTNPKVALFFLAFLPQFCNPALGGVGAQIIYFGILFIIASIIIFFSVAALGGKLADWLNRSQGAQITINRIAALVFLGLATALVFTER